MAKVKTIEINGHTLIPIDVKSWQVGKGHTPHRSGAGKHADRRTKRLKTRRAVLVAAMGE